MRASLGLTGGLIAAEAVMMALAPEIGRQHAHELVYAACSRVRDSGTELAVELRKAPEVAAILGDDRIDALCQGDNPVHPERILTGWARSRTPSPGGWRRCARRPR